MNTSQTAVTNAANLALFMVNFSQRYWANSGPQTRSVASWT